MQILIIARLWHHAEASRLWWPPNHEGVTHENVDGFVLALIELLCSPDEAHDFIDKFFPLLGNAVLHLTVLPETTLKRSRRAPQVEDFKEVKQRWINLFRSGCAVVAPGKGDRGAHATHEHITTDMHKPLILDIRSALCCSCPDAVCVVCVCVGGAGDRRVCA